MLGGRAILTPPERSSFLQSLDSKYKIPKYGKLHSVAFAELEIEKKLKCIGHQHPLTKQNGEFVK